MEWLTRLNSQLIGLDTSLRATYNLRTPDAIQIATALQEGATFFITNDTRLPEIQKLELLILDRLIT
ncbi:MAG: PIN domain-containing protein [Lyngbya sp.]|nr:PIN domain-containing protein [Lyngbya sp.]